MLYDRMCTVSFFAVFSLLPEGLEVAQLEGDRVLLDDQRGVGQPLRRLEFPFSVDHFGPALTLRLRLSGNRPLSPAVCVSAGRSYSQRKRDRRGRARLCNPKCSMA